MKKQQLEMKSQMTMITPNFSGKLTYEVEDAITELLRHNVKYLIATALEVEVNEVVNGLKSAGRDVARSGHLPERSVTTAVGDVEVEVPRIRSRDGNGSINFSSKLIDTVSEAFQVRRCVGGLCLPEGDLRT